MTKKIGRYKIKSEIGRGGMATVYRAFDPYFERDVAIKILPKEFLHDPQFRVRFDREAKTIASLEHPSIVPLYDFGEEDGQPYIVIRLMTGGTLANRLQHGPLPIQDIVNIISSVASALDAAHARGIIHRDLKPGNILLDQYGSVFLSDFGIARLAEASSSTITGLTGSAIIGTPIYMSPEHIQGEKIDGRSDIYALGVILFQMLTGQLPYKTNSPTKAIMANILEPVPSVLNLSPDLPPACDDVVQKALAKDRDKRFATAGELAIALQAAIYGEIHGIPLYPLKHPLQPSFFKKTSIFTILPRNWAIVVYGIVSLALLVGIFYVISAPSLMKRNTQTQEFTTPQISTEIGFIPPKPTIIPNTNAVTQIPVVITTQETTLTPFQSEIPIIAGADKIAFLNTNDIWLMNMDGSGLIELTKDGSDKSKLQWAEGGDAINYIVGKCVKSVDIKTGDIKDIACFEAADQLNDFEISTDSQEVAIILNNKLYIIPYNIEKLKQVRSRSDLEALGTCEYTSPYDYKKIKIKSIHWSSLSQRVAVVMEGNLALGIDKYEKRDVVQLLDNSPESNGICKRYLPVIDQFPYYLSDTLQIIANRFLIKGYEENPVFQNFTWDGDFLFAFVGYKRHKGFGDLYIYNSESKTADLEVNPINGACCYRDPQWSPDGRYLFFVFQNEDPMDKNKILFYLIKYATIGAGEKYDPIPIENTFFNDPTEKPNPILRPAKTIESLKNSSTPIILNSQKPTP
jgi:serine/threonine-protein kinase